MIVDLPITINIPASYVADKMMRLRLYRRLADIRSLDEVQALEEEFKDRFGPPPEAVYNLFYQLKIKLVAEKIGLASINSENGQLVLRFPDGTLPDWIPELNGRCTSRKDRPVDAIQPGKRLAGSLIRRTGKAWSASREIMD